MKKNIGKILLLFCVSMVTITGRAASETSDNNADTLVVICLNDFHGSFVQDRSLDIPGAGNIYSTVQKIKNRYPAHLVLAVGDNFGGSFFSNRTQGMLLPDFFQRLGITFSALGNHEFDNGQHFLADKWSVSRPNDWDITYLCANVVDSKSGRIPAYAISDTICQIKLNDDIIKVGIVGLVTSSAGSGTKKENVDGLTFRSDYKSVLDSICCKESQKNADLQVLVAHIGTEMKDNEPQWMEENIKQMVPTSIDGVASGHSHKCVIGYVDNIPVVQGEISGKYIGLLRFVRGSDGWKSISPELIKVEDVVDTSVGRAALDSIVNSHLVKADAPGMGMLCNVAYVKDTLLHDRNINSRSLTALGSYVCMSYAYAYRKHVDKVNMGNVVIAFSHFGGIRRSMVPGVLDILSAGEVLPFVGNLKVYELTGKQIRKIIESGCNNPKGQLQMNNLVVDTVLIDNKCRVVNVHYVVPGHLDIMLSDSEEYPVVVDEFITTGGDGYPESLFPDSCMIKHMDGLFTTASFLNFLWTLDEELTESYIYKARMNTVWQH